MNNCTEDVNGKVAIGNSVVTVNNQTNNSKISIINDLLDPANKLPTNTVELRNRILQGPYQLELTIYPRTQQGDKKRSFQAIWFKIYKWLEYSPSLDKAFCFSCRFFRGSNLNLGQIDYTFLVNGFTNWYKSQESFRKHQLSKYHLLSSGSLKQYLDCKPIDVLLNHEMEIIHTKKEADRKQNRKVMERLIDVVICLSKCEKPLRGHDESEKSLQKGLYLEIVQLLTKYDLVLKNHFENGPKNARYTSSSIQNDLIFSIQNVVKWSIKEKFNQKYISIIADETSDVGHHEQISIIFRYFDNSTKRPVEVFVGLRRLHFVKAESIFSVLDDIMIEYNQNWNSVLAVCFDGASTMSGHISGVQARSLEEICDSTQFCEYRAKGLGLLSQMKSFNFVFALFTMEPILQIILKVSSALQSPVLD
ncbi:zinc finger MYM-type protein 1-like [Aphis gossypii]|nr:zinc finger MYM-type protein 1-like [Aphis gossypii]